MFGPSGMRSQRGLASVAVFFFKCREQCVICIIGDSLSILLKLIRCLGAPLMKAYFNDLCCLFLWVKPPSTEEEGRGDNELIKMLTN